MRMINGGDKNERRSMEDFFNPKPDTATLVCTNTAATPLTYGGLKHHLAKQGGGKLKEQAEETKNSRWNPTAAQLLALEEKYRCGIRTPTTDQIQQITSQLRRFGKIEGKNVFYWFQNHKARERKKRRRRQGQQKHQNTGHESLNSLKESGPRRTVLGLHQTNNLVPHYSNCSDHHAEGPVSVNGAAIAESGTYGWSEFQERELQLMKSSSLGMHAVWKNMDLSSSTPAHHLTSAVTTAASKFSSFEEHSSLLKPVKTTAHANHDGEIREIQTLQLFPLCSDDDRNIPIRTIKTTFTPGQFFEFLPLKN